MTAPDMQIQCPHCGVFVPTERSGDTCIFRHCGSTFRIVAFVEDGDPGENPYLLHGDELDRAVQAAIRRER